MSVGPMDLDRWRRVCLDAYANLPADTSVTMGQVDQVLTLGAPRKAALDEGLWVAGAYEALVREVASVTAVLDLDVDAVLTQAAKPAAGLLATGDGTDLVALRLVPVEFFGAGCATHCTAENEPECKHHYGLMDAVQAWSDCNRAEGRTYRVDELDNAHREPGDTVEILVRRADLPWFSKRFGEAAQHATSGERLCAECGRPYDPRDAGPDARVDA